VLTPEPAQQQPKGKVQKRYWTGYGYMETKTIPSAMTPPWSTLTAYDLNTGATKWQIPFGNSPASSKGFKQLGSIWPKNGIVVTGSGLIFAAPRASGALYAYDERTGEVLWKSDLPTASLGVPAVYQVDGREYVVICADAPKGNRQIKQSSKMPLTRAYIAFALPPSGKSTVSP
jgi:quinoprotein glucose dehydrogenase